MLYYVKLYSLFRLRKRFWVQKQEMKQGERNQRSKRKERVQFIQVQSGHREPL